MLCLQELNVLTLNVTTEDGKWCSLKAQPDGKVRGLAELGLTPRRFLLLALSRSHCFTVTFLLLLLLSLFVLCRSWVPA